MLNEASYSSPIGDHAQQTERDLLIALLQSADVSLDWQGDEPNAIAQVNVAENAHSKIAYPWQPSDPAAEAFFDQLDQDFSWPNEAAHEVEQRSQVFYQHLDQLWAVSPLQNALTKKFVTAPQTLLSAIARQAQQLADTSSSLADQLLLCVQDILPQWASEDLEVLARPLAYAMRGDDTNAVDSALKSMRSVEWAELSDLEQARLSLTIARYAIAKLNEPTKLA